MERDKAKKLEEQAKKEKIQTAKQLSQLNATIVKLTDDNKELLSKHSELEHKLT